MLSSISRVGACGQSVTSILVRRLWPCKVSVVRFGIPFSDSTRTFSPSCTDTRLPVSGIVKPAALVSRKSTSRICSLFRLKVPVTFGQLRITSFSRALDAPTLVTRLDRFVLAALSL